MILRAYKTELDPTAQQRRALARHVAGARVAHNWTLWRWHVFAGLPRLVSFLRACAGIDDSGAAAAYQIGFFLHAFLFGERRATRRPKRTKKDGVIEYTEKVVFAARAPEGPIPDRSPDADWIHAQLTVAKKIAESPVAWLKELSAYAVREGAGDVGRGYQAYFRRMKKHMHGDHSECTRRRTGGCDLGEPRFRLGRDRHYHVDQPNPIRTSERTVTIPSIGEVRLKERGYFPVTHPNSHHFVYGGKICGLGVSERDGRWYAALRAEVPSPAPQKRGPGRALRDRPTPRVQGRRVGVENGVRVLVATYDGDSASTFVDSGLRDDERILRLVRSRKLWERRMARRWKKGVKHQDQSAGWREAVNRVRHYHARIVDLRDDRVGKAIRKIVDTGAEVALLREPHTADLLNRATAPDAQVRNRLAPDVHGARMGDVRRRLEYKMAWAGGRVEHVDRFEPVTKRCSACGEVRETSPSYPNFRCDACGHVEDRDDANAPKNLYSGGSSSGEAEPRCAAPKTPERGPNGREKREARAEEQSSVTASQGSETSALGSGNRASPGASRSARPYRSDHPTFFECPSDAQTGSLQFGRDTAPLEPTIEDRSQTAVQVHESTSGQPDGLEKIR